MTMSTSTRNTDAVCPSAEHWMVSGGVEYAGKVPGIASLA